MIGHLSGTIIDMGEETITLDVEGVGYRVFTSPTTLAELAVESEASLWIHTAVREDTLDLYGFEKKDEMEFFKLLIGISGIGPKTALGIISLAPVETLSSAIASEDTAYLTNVSGIGKKSAQKIVLELQDKLGDIASDTSSPSSRQNESEALEALKSLGYSAGEAREALKEIDESVEETSEKVRAALKILGG